jgi:hypothetical protein
MSDGYRERSTVRRGGQRGGTGRGAAPALKDLFLGLQLVLVDDEAQLALEEDVDLPTALR